MLKPLLLSVSVLMAGIAVAAGANLYGVLIRASDIKHEGVRLSDIAISSSFQAFSPAAATRLKSDYVSVIQKAKSNPLTRPAHWETLTNVSACSDFWMMARQVTENVALSFGQTGLYTPEELEFASQASQIAIGVVASTVNGILEDSGAPILQQTQTCESANKALLTFEAETIRRVQRNLKLTHIPPEALAEQTVLTMTTTMATLFRTVNTSFVR